MNIFLHELKAYRKSTLIWAGSLAAITIFFLAMYPAFARDVNATMKIMEGFPEAFRKAFGIYMENFLTPLGFYAYILVYVILCGAIQAMNTGTSILSKEIRDRTADFLMTKPVSRVRILTSKLLAAFTSIVFTNIILVAVALLTMLALNTGDLDMKLFFMVSVTLFFLQLIFLAMGILLSAAVSKIKSVISVSVGTVFGFFILNMLDSILGEKVIRYLTPFKYFDTVYILKNASYETPYLITGAAFIVAAVAASYAVYSRKDVHAV